MCLCRYGKIEKIHGTFNLQSGCCFVGDQQTDLRNAPSRDQRARVVVCTCVFLLSSEDTNSRGHEPTRLGPGRSPRVRAQSALSLS